MAYHHPGGRSSTACMLSLLVGFAASPGVAAEQPPALVFCCAADNDLYRVVSVAMGPCPRYDKPIDAVAAAGEASGVLVLADRYPDKTTTIAATVFEEAAKKRLRLYVEYPALLPGMDVGAPQRTSVERAVVASDFFGTDLARLRILAINGLHYVPVAAQRSHLVAARVAGFDSAIFGLPKQTPPLLFPLPDREVLVATTKLSHFVTGRYAPQQAWQTLWQTVLQWLAADRPIGKLTWTPSVRPSYRRGEPLPADHELQAIRRAVRWYENARLIAHPSYLDRVDAAAKANGIIPIPAGAPVGDGSLGILEAVLSVIGHDGRQVIGIGRRGDCTGESAMALAFSTAVLGEKRYAAIARRALDFYLFDSIARKGERGDPSHGAYGLVAWGVTNPAAYVANYGDDNARLMMGVWATAALNHDDRWDEAMMMCLLANLRTTGKLGFRTGRIDIGPLTQNGWRHYFNQSPVNCWPHYEAYLWACYLWAYHQTGYRPFYDRARGALKKTMDQYTDGWRWTNGLAQERARILLPLAWLVRAHDTPEHRALLRKAVEGLLTLQQPCGAIREELGLPGRGSYPPPQSNEAYGTTEASLIARDGDPVCDLLYTTNFAFLGLHEAAAVLGDRDVAEAADKLAEFLCRIQVTSGAHAHLDGGWFRAFDYARWEPWGSNADIGWGAWAIESGWTQGWITSVLAMRQMKTSLWDLTEDSRIERHFDRLREEMLPEAE